MSTQKTPDLIRLYIKSCMIGFALAALFVGLLLGMDVMSLGGLVAASNVGPLAVLGLWVLNGIVFAAVQFIFTIMGLADDDDDDRDGGLFGRVFLAEPVPVRIDRRQPPRR